MENVWRAFSALNCWMKAGNDYGRCVVVTVAPFRKKPAQAKSLDGHFSQDYSLA
jgi:hypothetical protein